MPGEIDLDHYSEGGSEEEGSGDVEVEIVGEDIHEGPSKPGAGAQIPTEIVEPEQFETQPTHENGGLQPEHTEQPRPPVSPEAPAAPLSAAIPPADAAKASQKLS